MKPGIYFILNKDGEKVGEAVYKNGLSVSYLFYKDTKTKYKDNILMFKRKYRFVWSSNL